ncbi:IucA/IucC family protein [Macrococcus carouselicus]|uniref:Siderophore biosynthesis protein, IucA/IucC family n=1 Tax=Macrococcus carouselicus TaxID=69969 RepID=A0A9Q8CG03_9STAP|nr:IucA/IucC family protein [Macrococcus carouselicus]TDM02410.1 siderophore biosynthesis protein, IucA/IucC family [Macrococcus carouselicus]
MWQQVVYSEAGQFSDRMIADGIAEAIAITNDKLIQAIAGEEIIAHDKTPSAWLFQLSDGAEFRYQPDERTIHTDETFDALQLVEWLSGHDEQWRQLVPEIENQLINQALSLIYCKVTPVSDNGFLKGEQLCVTGHNIHPCAKIRMDMPFSSVIQYSPEYNQAYQLNWLLVAEALLYADLEPALYQQLVQFSGYKEHVPQGYVLVPVHPYQFDHVIPAVYSEEIAAGQIVPLKRKGGWVKSTSSFRTVCPLDSNYPVIKLPIDVQMTSTKRSISNRTVMNAKKLSRYIAAIYEEDSELNAISRPVYELGGMTMRSPSVDKQRNLSFLLRENISPSLLSEELYCANCLFEEINGRASIIKQLLAESGRSPIDWFERYVELLNTVVLKMMTVYGIGLEAHLQNISMAFADGFPSRIFFRDWGGIRIDQSRTPNLLLEEGLTTADTEAMYEKVQNTWISNHLTELVQFFMTLGYSEEKLWHIVRQNIARFYSTHPHEDYRHLTSPYIYEKALLQMRLSPEEGDIYIRKKNPLKEYACL